MMMIGELNYFIGLQLGQTHVGTSIHQQKYVKELFKRFNLEDTKEIDTRIARARKFYMEGTNTVVEQKLYRGMIG